MPNSKDITFDDLAKYFHLPINQVAKELGICATILKKICRKNGIPRWPHRKIKSLDKRLAYLEETIKKEPQSAQELEAEIAHLRRKKNEILKNPSTKTLGHASYMKPVASPIAKGPHTSHHHARQTHPTTPVLMKQEIVHPEGPVTFQIADPAFKYFTCPPTFTAVTGSPFLTFTIDGLTAQPASELEAMNRLTRSSRATLALLGTPSPAVSAPRFNEPSHTIRIPSGDSNSTSQQELPSFKFLFDVVEGERARLMVPEPSTEVPHQPSDMASVTAPSFTLPQAHPNTAPPMSVFPDWYLEEKSRVLGK